MWLDLQGDDAENLGRVWSLMTVQDSQGPGREEEQCKACAGWIGWSEVSSAAPGSDDGVPRWVIELLQLPDVDASCCCSMLYSELDRDDGILVLPCTNASHTI